MPNPKSNESPEEKRAALEAYDRFLEEAMANPLKFLTHDNMTHADEKLSRLVAKHDMSWYGWYWLLAELLAGRNDHSYDVSDEYGWRRLAHDMSCMCDMSDEECREFVVELYAFDLISREIFDELHKVVITRIRKDANAYAEKTATKKLGAWKTNRKRTFG